MRKVRTCIAWLTVVLLVFGVCLDAGAFFQKEPDEIIVIAPEAQRFAADAETWDIEFSLISTGAKREPRLELEEVKLNGVPLDPEQLELNSKPANKKGRLPVIMAGRFIPREELREWNLLRLLVERGFGLLKVHLDRLHYLTSMILDKFQEVPQLQDRSKVATLTIPANTVEVEEDSENELEVTFSVAGAEEEEVGFKSDIIVHSLPSIPGNSQWVPGDPHIHSNWSDGLLSLDILKRIMRNRGYYYVYLSDGHHTKKLFDDRWEEYKKAVYEVSDDTITFFPGVETAVGSQENEQGHLLVHGTNESIAGLEEHTLSPQEMIIRGVMNEPGVPTSCTMPHPISTYSWGDYSVFGHSGMELMSSGLQYAYDLYCANAVKWREELMRHLEYAINGGTFPSPRTATDYHGIPVEPLKSYVTWVYLPELWASYDYQEKKDAIDRAFYQGRVSISRHGSLGFFTLDGEKVGSVIHNVAPGTELPLEVEYRSVRRGEVKVSIFRDNVEETVFEETVDLNVGDLVRWSDTIVFPGGNHLYWLYAEGRDYAFSSPIFVSSGGPGKIPGAPTVNTEEEWTGAEEVTVEISPGTGAVLTEYCLSGAVSAEWKPYTGPFTVAEEGETRITARCIGVMGNASDEVEAIVKIDRTSPEISVTAGRKNEDEPADCVTVRADFSDLLSGVDEGTRRYTLDGGEEWHDYKGPVSIEEPGRYEFIFQVRDRAGNTAEVSEKLDIQKLETVSRPDLSDEGRVTWVDVDNARGYQVRLYCNGQEFGEAVTVENGASGYNFDTVLDEAGEGEYYVRVKARGSGLYLDGDYSEKSKSITVEEETLDPETPGIPPIPETSGDMGRKVNPVFWPVVGLILAVICSPLYRGRKKGRLEIQKSA